jgi:hypothetical protein
MVFLVHSGDSITGTSIACFGLEMVKAITDAWGLSVPPVFSRSSGSPKKAFPYPFYHVAII